MTGVIKSLYRWLDAELPEQYDERTAGQINWLRCLPFVLTHLMCFGVFWVGISFSAVAVCFLGYALRVFALTGFFHRRFSHRAFDTSRVVQFIFAFIATAAAQRGPLWWSAHHRFHHKHSDEAVDKHSPITNSFIHSHCLWFLTNENFATQKHLIKDFIKYPELVFLNRFDMLPPLIYGLVLYFVGGWQMLIWGYFVSTVLVYHVTFSINSIAHKIGTRDYDTKDHSRNNWWLAILTFGEGWHNNHHHYPSSARQGFKSHQIDITYYILFLMQRVGLVWGVRLPPEELTVSNNSNVSHESSLV